MKELALCYGGMSYYTVEASKTECSLLGRYKIHVCIVLNSSAVSRCWDEEMLKDAIKLLLEEFPLPPDVPGGMPEYRRSLTISFFFKFYWTIRSQISGVK